jgi:hypothetical protein
MHQRLQISGSAFTRAAHRSRPAWRRLAQSLRAGGPDGRHGSGHVGARAVASPPSGPRAPPPFHRYTPIGLRPPAAARKSSRHRGVFGSEKRTDTAPMFGFSRRFEWFLHRRGRHRPSSGEGRTVPSSSAQQQQQQPTRVVKLRLHLIDASADSWHTVRRTQIQGDEIMDVCLGVKQPRRRRVEVRLESAYQLVLECSQVQNCLISVHPSDGRPRAVPVWPVSRGIRPSPEQWRLGPDTNEAPATPGWPGTAAATPRRRDATGEGRTAR